MRYAAQVRCFGSDKWNINKNGDKFNLSHRDEFGPDDVETDGAGNVIDMPLLRRKPCFGRPERLHRAAIDTRVYIDDSGGEHRDGACERCPVSDACAKVCDERVGSSPEIVAAFDTFYAKAKGYTGKRAFHAAHGAWRAVLIAIENHGGWSNVNDTREAAAANQRDREIAKRRNANRRAKRARERRERRGNAKPLDKAFLDNLEAGRTLRLEALLELRGRKNASRTLSQLTENRCRLTADIWWVRERLKRTGERVTGRAIAETLEARRLDQGIAKPTLAMNVARSLKRIETLESDTSAGRSVWPAFEG